MADHIYPVVADGRARAPTCGDRAICQHARTGWCLRCLQTHPGPAKRRRLQGCVVRTTAAHAAGSGPSRRGG